MSMDGRAFYWKKQTKKNIQHISQIHFLTNNRLERPFETLATLYLYPTIFHRNILVNTDTLMSVLCIKGYV